MTSEQPKNLPRITPIRQLPHVCDKCDHRFKTWYSLQIHRDHYTDTCETRRKLNQFKNTTLESDTRAMVQCPLCHRLDVSRANIRKHLKTKWCYKRWVVDPDSVAEEFEIIGDMISAGEIPDSRASNKPVPNRQADLLSRRREREEKLLACET